MKYYFYTPLDEELKLWLNSTFEVLGHQPALPADIVIVAGITENLFCMKDIEQCGIKPRCVVVLTDHPEDMLSQAFRGKPSVIAVLEDTATDPRSTLELARQIIAVFEKELSLA